MLAPGFYASQDIKTPVRIAVVVLVITQALNVALVPVLQHAGLALAIGLGALVNALWLLVGLVRRGSYRPAAGWAVFGLQVVAASSLLAVFLLWSGGRLDWTGGALAHGRRIGWLALLLTGGAALYFLALVAAGLRLKSLLRR